MRNGLAPHLAAAAWTLLCAGLLLVPGSMVRPPGEGPIPIDWLEDPAHGVLSLVLAGLWLGSLPRIAALRHPRAWALAGSLAYLVALEGIQELVPGRGWEWTDLGFTVAGIAAAAALDRLLRGPRRRAAAILPLLLGAILFTPPA